MVEGRASYDIGLAAGLTDAYPHLRHLVVSRSLSGPFTHARFEPVEQVDLPGGVRVVTLDRAR